MTTNAPLISIITPAYNAEKTIVKTIQSVLDQSYKNWELIIIDDGSQDETRNIVSKLSVDDSRIVLFTQKNSGPAIARQKGLDNSKGRFIAFLDSDDLWLPEKLEKQITFMIKNNIIFSYTSFRRVHPDNLSFGHKILIPPQLSYRQLLGNTAIATSTVIVDKSKSGQLKMENCYCDDFVLWLSILKRGILAHGLDEDLMRYRVLSNSWSRNKWKNAREVWLTYRNIEKMKLFDSFLCFTKYSFNAAMKYKLF